MELEVQERKEYAEGKHTGIITKIEYREKPFKYTDIFVQPDDFEIPIKYGCPTILSEGSKLFKLVLRFVPLKVGQKIDVEKVLVNKKVQFVTVNEETSKGVFARIADGSLKLVGQSDVIEPENEGDV